MKGVPQKKETKKAPKGAKMPRGRMAPPMEPMMPEAMAAMIAKPKPAKKAKKR